MDMEKYHQIIQDYNYRFGGNKRYQDTQYSPDYAKKQKIVDDDIETEELYVSDQTFWMWGTEKEGEVEKGEITGITPDTELTTENDDMHISEGINLMLMDDNEAEGGGATDFYL